MRYTELGATDLNVSRICLGTWQFGGDIVPVGGPSPEAV